MTTERRDAWNEQFDELITMIEKYEDEHPDDAKCFTEAIVKIDGKPHRVRLELNDH